MGKLGNKEVILILVVINFMLYYMMVFIAVNPLKSSIKENNEQIEALQKEYDDKKAIVDSEETYKQTIETLKAEKAKLFESGFPNTNPENLHAFMVKEAEANHITIGSISINQAPRKATSNNGQEETGILDNKLNLSIKGSYLDIINLIKSVEGEERTSLLTSFSLNGEKEEMSSSLSYDFLSADKEDNTDPIFDHQFGQSVGDKKLFR